MLAPIVVWLGSVVLSVASLRRHRSAACIALAAVVFVCGGLGTALNVYQVVIEAWPTYLFHLMIGIALVAAIVQGVLTRRAASVPGSTAGT